MEDLKQIAADRYAAKRHAAMLAAARELERMTIEDQLEEMQS